MISEFKTISTFHRSHIPFDRADGIDRMTSGMTPPFVNNQIGSALKRHPLMEDLRGR